MGLIKWVEYHRKQTDAVVLCYTNTLLSKGKNLNETFNSNLLWISKRQIVALTFLLILKKYFFVLMYQL